MQTKERQASSQIANRLREVILSGEWIARTNLKDQLDAVSFEEAISQVSSLNTIAKLTFHINYYIAGLLNVFEGGKLEIKDKFSFDMQELTSEAEWTRLKNDLYSNAEKFAAHVEQMSEDKLNEVFVHENYGDYRRNIEGIIEHSYYHFGQISLIRKLLKDDGRI